MTLCERSRRIGKFDVRKAKKIINFTTQTGQLPTLETEPLLYKYLLDTKTRQHQLPLEIQHQLEQLPSWSWVLTSEEHHLLQLSLEETIAGDSTTPGKPRHILGADQYIDAIEVFTRTFKTLPSVSTNPRLYYWYFKSTKSGVLTEAQQRRLTAIIDSVNYTPIMKWSTRYQHLAHYLSVNHVDTLEQITDVPLRRWALRQARNWDALSENHKELLLKLPSELFSAKKRKTAPTEKDVIRNNLWYTHAKEFAEYVKTHQTLPTHLEGKKLYAWWTKQNYHQLTPKQREQLEAIPGFFYRPRRTNKTYTKKAAQ